RRECISARRKTSSASLRSTTFPKGEGLVRAQIRRFAGGKLCVWNSLVSPSVTALACGSGARASRDPWLGHAAALTAHWAVIHYRVAACGSLKEGACDMPFVTGNANLCGKERCFAPRKITRERNFFHGFFLFFNADSATIRVLTEKTRPSRRGFSKSTKKVGNNF
ncbi:MAG: hypothetical protein IIZ49_02890, partial [Oscillospiraceae bacterium]|nr:hypothetical protein [Oscillospiraceae bacterium]